MFQQKKLFDCEMKKKRTKRRSKCDSLNNLFSKLRHNMTTENANAVNSNSVLVPLRYNEKSIISYSANYQKKMLFIRNTILQCK